jgi:hypothetical protein
MSKIIKTRVLFSRGQLMSINANFIKQAYIILYTTSTDIAIWLHSRIILLFEFYTFIREDLCYSTLRELNIIK